jgi:hypothetical protein
LQDQHVLTHLHTSCFAEVGGVHSGWVTVMA